MSDAPQVFVVTGLSGAGRSTALRVLENATLKGLLRRVIGKIFGDKLVIEGYCGEFEARNAPSGATGSPPVG